MSHDLKHWGIPGMRWGQRKREDEGSTRQKRIHAQNVKNSTKENGLLKPTFQYRDSQGNLVSSYGPGKYGGGPKPDTTSKKAIASDKKFMSDVEKLSKKQEASKVDSKKLSLAQKFTEKYKNNPSKLIEDSVVAVGTAYIAAVSAMTLSAMFAPSLLETVAWHTGKIVSNGPL